jgi:NADH dehydrogenase (ubiquinone) 1 beta subcomplex subunit 7
MEEARVMKVSEEEMKAAKLDVGFRDYCAHLLIPLNKCRHETFYMPWKCTDERHTYEQCQYVEHLRSVKRKLDSTGGYKFQ